MASFVEMAGDTDYPRVHGPYFIADNESPVTYLQDVTESRPRKMSPASEQISATARYVVVSQQDSKVAESLLWPKKAWTDADPKPFAWAAIAALYGSVAFDREVGIGAALVAGYFVGALTFYIDQRLHPQLTKPSDQIQQVDRPDPPTPLRPLVL